MKKYCTLLKSFVIVQTFERKISYSNEITFRKMLYKNLKYAVFLRNLHYFYRQKDGYSGNSAAGWESFVNFTENIFLTV